MNWTGSWPAIANARNFLRSSVTSRKFGDDSSTSSSAAGVLGLMMKRDPPSSRIRSYQLFSPSLRAAVPSSSALSTSATE